MIIFQIAVICLIQSIGIKCEVGLQRTLSNEVKIIKSVGSFVEQLSTTVRSIDRKLEKVLMLKWSDMDKSDYISTPLTVMVLVRRLVQDWSTLAFMVGRISRLSSFPNGKFRWPTPLELEAATRTVKRSQMTYELNTALMVKGIQSDVFLTNVTAADCFELGRLYFKRERFSEAKEWLQQALSEALDGHGAPSRESLLYYWAAAHCFTGDINGSINIISNIIKSNLLSKPPMDLTYYFSIMVTRGCVYPEKQIVSLLDKHYQVSHSDQSANKFNRDDAAVKAHSRLCRGYVASDSDSRLVCRYVHYMQPHLKLQPFKLEELQLDPPVVRFCDLITDNEAQSLMAEAKQIMQPAKVSTRKGGRVANSRTSFIAWLMSDRFDWLTRRVSEATRLDATFADPHQLSRYSVSGEYLPHGDFFSFPEKYWTYDRAATVMFYLNEVELRGRTVFTQWNLSVAPVKNSAVMWFNFKPSGQSDGTSQHSGCPVLKGTKWVLNKWIFNGGNRAFPCTIDKEGSFKGFYL